MDHHQLVARLADAYRRADLETIGQMCAADIVQHHPLSPVPIEGRDAVVAAERALLTAFPGVDVTVHHALSAGATVAAEVTIVATHTGPLDLGDGTALPPTGRRIQLPAVWVMELDGDGLIAVERDYLDTATFFAQLGLQEPASV